MVQVVVSGELRKGVVLGSSDSCIPLAAMLIAQMFALYERSRRILALTVSAMGAITIATCVGTSGNLSI